MFLAGVDGFVPPPLTIPLSISIDPKALLVKSWLGGLEFILASNPRRFTNDHS